MRVSRWFLAGFCAVAAAVPGFAQENECGADIKTACKDATGKDVLGCIEQQQNNFSDACKKKI